MAIPVIAIAAALGIGALVNRGKHDRQYRHNLTPRELMPTPEFSLKLVGQSAGNGIPFTRDSKPAFGPEDAAALDTIAWARFDYQTSPETASPDAWLRLQDAVTATVKDESGKLWPSTMRWLGSSVAVTIPPGYANRPKKLTASVYVYGRQSATQSLPSLPEPQVFPAPKLSQAWEGLVVEPVAQPASQTYGVQIFIDSPLPAGHILAGKLLGTSLAKLPPQYLWGVKGPEPAPYMQTLFCPLRYPASNPKIFVEAVQYAPVHVQKRLHFANVPHVVKFGAPWIIGRGNDVPFQGDVSFNVIGSDVVPFRPGLHQRRSIILQLASQGLVRHVRARLVGPTTALSIPFVFRSATFTLEDIKPSATGGNWTTGPLDIDMDIEADVYKVVRKATVAVDLGKAKPHSLPDGNRIRAYEIAPPPGRESSMGRL